MKGIQPVKTEWWDAGVVTCLGQGADLHMAQMMPLPLTLRLVLPFWCRLTQGGPDKIQEGHKTVCYIADSLLVLSVLFIQQFCTRFPEMSQTNIIRYAKAKRGVN